MLAGGHAVEVKRLDVGDQIGPFKLTKFLGQGGMASVYEASHLKLERTVAIKVLNHELIDRADVVERFFKEAQAVNRIRHGNIVEIADFVEADEYPPYMVMEYLGGEPLSKYIKDNAPIPPAKAVKIALQIASALAAVHDVGIVHRDLKPDNIFLTEGVDGSLKVKLLDFGIAKFMAPEEGGMTQPGELFGTPEYMSPEQVRGGRVDHRIDVYALGVILYEMLCGRQPFAATDLIGEQAQPPSAWLGGLKVKPIPKTLEDVVMACLVKEAEARVQDMHQLQTLLKRSMAEDATGVHALLSASKKIKRFWIYAASGVAVLALAAGVIWWAIPGRKASARKSKKAKVVKPRPVQRPAPQIKTVQLTSEPAGASIYRTSDGQFVGQTPSTVKLAKGEKVQLLLRLKGYEDKGVDLDDSRSFVEVVLFEKDKGKEATRTSSRRRRRASKRRSKRRKRRSARKRRRRRSRKGGKGRLVNPFK
jgi:serine/threonine-protein kinase